MTLHGIDHDDPRIEEFKEQISEYIQQIEPLGFVYRLYLEEDQPVGIALIGQEPLQLFAPVGTPLIRFSVLDYDQPLEVLNAFADEVLNLAKARSVDFAYLNIPVEQSGLAKHLERVGFEELANRYEMTRPLDTSFTLTKELQYSQVKRQEVNQFFDQMKECMSGSPDVILNLVMKNFRNVPEALLDLWYSMVQAYFVYHDDEVVGILDLVPQAGLVQNIGVAPKHRGHGFGAEMLRFSLNLFKETGREKAELGVHVENKPAIRLYEKLGFSVNRQIQTFIWWKPT